VVEGGKKGQDFLNKKIIKAKQRRVVHTKTIGIGGGKNARKEERSPMQSLLYNGASRIEGKWGGVAQGQNTHERPKVKRNKSRPMRVQGYRSKGRKASRPQEKPKH